MTVPDQFRADVFIKEFNEKWMPNATSKGDTITTGHHADATQRPRHQAAPKSGFPVHGDLYGG